MLLALVIVLLLVAAVFALTQIGWLVTLLFVGALLVLAYQRLSLLAFSATFTVLLAIYSWLGAPSGVWKGVLWVLLTVLWLLNVRPLRKALITRPFVRTYLKLLPKMSQTESEALAAGTVWWDGELFTGRPRLEQAAEAAAATPHAARAGLHRRPVRNALRHARRLRHHASPRRPAARGLGLREARGLLRHDHSAALRRPGAVDLRALVRARQDLEPQRAGVIDRRRAQLARAR